MRATLATVLLFAGVGVLAVCVLGALVMRDALDRLHCASAAGFGVLLVGISVVVQESFSLIGNTALLTGVVLVLASPVLAHATARTIRIREHGEWRARRQEHGN